MKKTIISFLAILFLLLCKNIYTNPQKKYEENFKNFSRFRTQKQYEKAAFYAKIAYKTAIDSNIKPAYSLLINAAWLFQNLKNPDYKTSILYCNKTLKYYPKKRLIAFQFIFNALLRLRNYKKLQNLISQHLRQSDEKNFSKFMFAKLSEFYHYTNQLSKALYYAKKSEPRMIQHFMSRVVTITHNYLFKKAIISYLKRVKKGIIYIPLPMNTYYQNFISLKSYPQYKSILSKGRYNFAVFDFRKGFPKRLTMIIKVKSFGAYKKFQKVQSHSQLNSFLGYYSNFENFYYNYKQPLIKKRVHRITYKLKNNIYIIRALQKWVAENIKHDSKCSKEEKRILYQKMPKNIASVLKAGYGHCERISSLFIGMLRNHKIPVRKIYGMYYSFNKNKIIATNHYTVEIYDAKLREWIYIEPQGKISFAESNPRHIIYSFLPYKKFPKLKKYRNYIPIAVLHLFNKSKQYLANSIYPVSYQINFTY